MPPLSALRFEIMSIELTDLLPEERRRVLRRDYFFRLGTITVVAVLGLLASAAALLVPTYVFLSHTVQIKIERLATIDSGLASADELGLPKRLAALTTAATTLAALGSSAHTSTIVRDALLVPRPGITLNSFSYTPGVAPNSGILLLAGIAATRDALRTYQLALQSASFVKAADLPVSAFAQDTRISFTITVTLAP